MDGTGLFKSTHRFREGNEGLELSSNLDFEVVIVGAGPVGLTLANLLGLLGVRVCVLEKAASLTNIPRAVSLDDEGLRVIQMTGLLPKLLPHMLMGYDHRLFGRKKQLLLEVAPDKQEFGFPKRNRFHQPILEEELLKGLKRFPHVALLFGAEFSEYQRSATGISCTFRVSGELKSISAKFLVGADGGASHVRKLSGIRMEGKSHPQPWLVIDTEDNPDVSRYSRVVADPGRPFVSVPGTEGRRRYEFMVHAGENPDSITSAASIGTLLGPHCDLTKVRVTRNSVYTFHSLVAERFSAGNAVFLAGDAAHMMPPFQGQGLNSGLRDVAILAWLLRAALSFRVGENFLENYDLERRPHAQEMIALSERVGRILMTTSRLKALLRDWAFRLLAVLPSTRVYLRTMGFKPSPHRQNGFFLLNGGGPAGRLLPQPVVLNSDGSQVALDSLLGNWFAAITFGDTADDLKDQLGHPVWQHLKLRRIAVLPGGVSRPCPWADETVGDIADGLRKMTGARSGQTLLVRPDRYIAAVVADGNSAAVADWLSSTFDLPEQEQ